METCSPFDQRIQQLRRELKRRGIFGYIIPMTDPHGSEYVQPFWQRIGYLCGFTGSAGTLIVDLEGSRLWTDSRYFIQAVAELAGSEVQLMRSGTPDCLTLDTWCESRYSGVKIAIDPLTIAVEQGRKLQQVLQKVGGELVCLDQNLVDQIWTDRPALFLGSLDIVPFEHCGESLSCKLSRVRERLYAKEPLGKNIHLVLTALDSIAWLLNLRGKDISCSSVFISYLIVSFTENLNKVLLFIDRSRINPSVVSYLECNSIEVCDYNSFYEHLATCTGEVVYDPRRANFKVSGVLDSDKETGLSDPVPLLKSQKNDIEQDGLRACHRRDGFAVTRCLFWLYSRWDVDKDEYTRVSEVACADRLLAFRSVDPLFVSHSFEPIVGWRANGAIVHYRPMRGCDAVIADQGILLVDSGGHYIDGTTDITRTVIFGTPSKVMKEMYTRVLKGHIALSRLIFPASTEGALIDVCARQYLWEVGRNYGHGTGHGIGHNLNVHEFPPSIAPLAKNSPLKRGMVVSNEPGYYCEGEFGIRIENILLVVPVSECSSESEFLKFQTLTKVPYCRELIDLDLLSVCERTFINDYHNEVFLSHQEFIPLLEPAERDGFVNWLETVCNPL